MEQETLSGSEKFVLANIARRHEVIYSCYAKNNSKLAKMVALAISNRPDFLLVFGQFLNIFGIIALFSLVIFWIVHRANDNWFWMLVLVIFLLFLFGFVCKKSAQKLFEVRERFFEYLDLQYEFPNNNNENGS